MSVSEKIHERIISVYILLYIFILTYRYYLYYYLVISHCFWGSPSFTWNFMPFSSCPRMFELWFWPNKGRLRHSKPSFTKCVNKTRNWNNAKETAEKEILSRRYSKFLLLVFIKHMTFYCNILSMYETVNMANWPCIII